MTNAESINSKTVKISPFQSTSNVLSGQFSVLNVILNKAAPQ